MFSVSKTVFPITSSLVEQPIKPNTQINANTSAISFFIQSLTFLILELAYFCSLVSIQAVLTIKTISVTSRITIIQGQISPSTVAECTKNCNFVPPKARSSWRNPKSIAIIGQLPAIVNLIIPLALLLFENEYIPLTIPQADMMPINQIMCSPPTSMPAYINSFSEKTTELLQSQQLWLRRSSI